MQQKVEGRKRAVSSRATPSGVEKGVMRSSSGGVASLNHRLIAVTPSGVNPRINTCHVEWSLLRLVEEQDHSFTDRSIACWLSHVSSTAFVMMVCEWIAYGVGR